MSLAVLVLRWKESLYLIYSRTETTENQDPPCRIPHFEYRYACKRYRHYNNLTTSFFENDVKLKRKSHFSFSFIDWKMLSQTCSSTGSRQQQSDIFLYLFHQSNLPSLLVGLVSSGDPTGSLDRYLPFVFNLNLRRKPLVNSIASILINFISLYTPISIFLVGLPHKAAVSPGGFAMEERLLA